MDHIVDVSMLVFSFVLVVGIFDSSTEVPHNIALALAAASDPCIPLCFCTFPQVIQVEQVAIRMPFCPLRFSQDHLSNLR